MKISEELRKARDYEAAYAERQDKAVFHLCAPVGWINDPNGFSLYRGEYHLFYQYYPYRTVWGPMHWGHSVTRDFIAWEQRPAALAPDTEYDGQGCFSGSALDFEGRHVLMYTGVQEGENGDGTHWVRQRQCIAAGDGTDYEKLEENPVIPAELLPAGSSLSDFRDPKIWREDGMFFAVAGSRAADGCGQIPLFESPDLKSWTFRTILESCGGEYGKMWECPDFFPLEGRHVLVVSPQDMKASGLTFHNGNGTLYLLGTYDKEHRRFTRERADTVEYGLDFYAPQTAEAQDGRRIMVGWMQSWDNHICPEGRNWSGMMTVPRELSLRGGALCQNPVRELEAYRKAPVLCEIPLEAGGEETSVPGIKGRSVDLTVEVPEGSRGTLRIAVAKGNGYHTDICYDADKHLVAFDRTWCGIRKDFIASRTMPVRDRNGAIKLRILLDYGSVELFANDGEQAMTSLIGTPKDADGITFSSTKKCLLHVSKYEIVV